MGELIMSFAYLVPLAALGGAAFTGYYAYKAFRAPSSLSAVDREILGEQRTEALEASGWWYTTYAGLGFVGTLATLQVLKNYLKPQVIVMPAPAPPVDPTPIPSTQEPPSQQTSPTPAPAQTPAPVAPARPRKSLIVSLALPGINSKIASGLEKELSNVEKIEVPNDRDFPANWGTFVNFAKSKLKLIPADQEVDLVMVAPLDESLEPNNVAFNHDNQQFMADYELIKQFTQNLQNRKGMRFVYILVNPGGLQRINREVFPSENTMVTSNRDFHDDEEEWEQGSFDNFIQRTLERLEESGSVNGFVRGFVVPPKTRYTLNPAPGGLFSFS